MTSIEEQLSKEISKILNKEIEDQSNDDLLNILKDNILMCIYSHQNNLIDFDKLKVSLDILLSVFYKSFPEEQDKIYNLVEDLSVDYAGNTGTVIYFQLLTIRNNIVKSKVLKQSTLKHN